MKDCSGLGAGVAYLIANFGSSENYSQLAGEVTFDNSHWLAKSLTGNRIIYQSDSEYTGQYKLR